MPPCLDRAPLCDSPTFLIAVTHHPDTRAVTQWRPWHPYKNVSPHSPADWRFYSVTAKMNKNSRSTCCSLAQSEEWGVGTSAVGIISDKILLSTSCPSSRYKLSVLNWKLTTIGLEQRLLLLARWVEFKHCILKFSIWVVLCHALRRLEAVLVRVKPI